MKRPILLLIAILAAVSVSAQEIKTNTTIKYSKEKSIVQTDTATIITTVKTRPLFSPKHDIRAGVGSLGLVTGLFLGSVMYDYDSDSNFREDMKNSNTYISPRNFVGNYSLSYTYHDRHWLQYGGTLAFGASTCRRRDIDSGKSVENLDYYIFSAMPSVRFVWFYRDKVQLYSSISVGVITDFYDLYVWGDVALIGCTFGRKLFGFVELGGGMTGVARMGIGYRFDAKIKK